MDAIQTQRLGKRYKTFPKRPRRALEDLSIQVIEGETYGFLGRNGAGKTTTIKILCSLLRPTSGEALIFGESVRKRRTRRLIGYLPEQPYFYEYLTPRETLDFYGRLQGLSSVVRAREWDKLSELLDLRDVADQRIRGFSKGMRQRVGFAVALVGDPPLLILDEPMSGLDPVGRRAIRELMRRLSQEKKTLFFSSHVLADVEQICDRVGILVQGRLVRQGRIQELIGNAVPRVEVVATALPRDAANALAASAESHRVHDAADYFVFSEENLANEAVRGILGAGGTLCEFTPVKESLEAFFMREMPAHERKGVA